MKKTKIISIILIAIILVLNLALAKIVQAEPTEGAIRITLSDESILVNDQAITDNPSESIYLTKTTNNGGTSENAASANIAIGNIVNINASGVYEFTGTLSDGQIAIDSNKINGNVTIILNNTNITCKNAPAIFVYNSDNKSSTCTVNIRLADGSTNTIAGGKIKQSVEGWVDQTNLLYYVEKGYDDNNTYYERYKYDGAISSDISLTFDGTGTLTVNALSKEGIETKRNITIDNGNYIINSLDDGINACTDGESIITINNGTILVNVSPQAEEGDGIDSNGAIYINGGTIYAFASEKSMDNGLDADTGIYINGGYVVGTGNMADEVSETSKQVFMQMQFNEKIAKNTLITILNADKKPAVAFRANREYSILTISSPNLQTGEHFVYEGGTIVGTNQNGLYTEIISYEGGTEKDYNEPLNMMKREDLKNVDKQKYEDIFFYTMLGLSTVLIMLVILTILLIKTGKVNIKGNLVILIIGIIIGAMITIGTLYHIYPWENSQGQDEFKMQGRPDMPMQEQNGEKPLEKPNGPKNQGNPNQGEAIM